MNQRQAAIEALSYIDLAFTNYNMDGRIGESHSRADTKKIEAAAEEILEGLRNRRRRLEKTPKPRLKRQPTPLKPTQQDRRFAAYFRQRWNNPE